MNNYSKYITRHRENYSKAKEVIRYSKEVFQAINEAMASNSGMLYAESFIESTEKTEDEKYLKILEENEIKIN